MSAPTYRDLLYFKKMLYTTVFAVMDSLAPFYWGCFIFLISYIWIDTICPTPWDWLHWMCYIACNDWKIHLSFVSETAWALGVLLYVRNILGHHFNLHHFTRHSRPRKTRIQQGSAAGFAQGWTRESGRVPVNICAVCRCILWENKTSKQGKNICTFVCVSVFVRFLHITLT